MSGSVSIDDYGSYEIFLESCLEAIKDGEEPSFTVREFLWYFGAQRRVSSAVYRIRDALQSYGLRTWPDFESAYIDSYIVVVLDEREPSESIVEESDLHTQSGLPDVLQAEALGVYSAKVTGNDPTYRISKLSAANSPPLSVSPDTSMQEAVTLMLAKDFSQLPVMTTEREVKGVISWASIGARLALGGTGGKAGDMMDPPQELNANASLFEAIPTIIQHQYVLVRAADKRITGLITASDLSLQFMQLTEPFLLLSEIENYIRMLISARIPTEQLVSVKDPTDSQRIISSVHDLTFGEYIRLLEEPKRWSSLKLAIDRAVFCEWLEKTRSTRNDVMHFDPDGIPPQDLDALRSFAFFLQQLHRLGVI